MGLQATNAGIDFQQRVSAYMMILMEFDMDISLALQVNKSNTIKEINFEDCESIDDLVITLDSGKKIYFQMKRTISLSDDSESEFFGVCEQFVNQFLKHEYSCAVTPQVRQTGNRLSGLAGTAYASLFT